MDLWTILSTCAIVPALRAAHQCGNTQRQPGLRDVFPTARARAAVPTAANGSAFHVSTALKNKRFVQQPGGLEGVLQGRDLAAPVV